MPGLVSRSLVLDEQQVHHQPDDLAGREVLAGGLVGELGEPADQLLVEVAHLQVRDRRRGAGRCRRTSTTTRYSRLARSSRSIWVSKSNLLEDVAGRGGEAGDVGAQVVGDGRPGRRAARRSRACEVLKNCSPGGLLQDRVDVLDLALQLRGPVEHLRLGRLQHAVEAAQHRERQDHPAVLGLLVVAPQQVGDRPDEGRVVLDAVPAGRAHSRVVLPDRDAPS